MSETAVEIQRATEKLSSFRTIHRFSILCMYYHRDVLGKICSSFDCTYCKFIGYTINFLLTAEEKIEEEKIECIRRYCRQNSNEFYKLDSLLTSLAAVERKKKS